MNSCPTAELASDGLIWRDAMGRVTCSMTAVAGIDEVAVVMRGDPPLSWSPEATQHLSKILAEVARNAEIEARLQDAEPIVPHCAPPADAAAPWG